MPFASLLLSVRRCALLGVCVMGVWAHAQTVAPPTVADRDQPLHAEADELRYDDVKKTNIFTGNVVITKGTIVIRGDRVEIRQDAQGNQFGVVESSEKRLAFFRQQRQGLNEWVEGEALRIDYDSSANTVVLTGQAVMRRLKGTQINDETQGEVITYNSATDEFKVKGREAQAKTPPGRVRLMLTPESKQGSGVVSGPATLKPSTQLGKQP